MRTSLLHSGCVWISKLHTETKSLRQVESRRRAGSQWLLGSFDKHSRKCCYGPIATSQLFSPEPPMVLGFKMITKVFPIIALMSAAIKHLRSNDNFYCRGQWRKKFFLFIWGIWSIYEECRFQQRFALYQWEKWLCECWFLLSDIQLLSLRERND